MAFLLLLCQNLPNSCPTPNFPWGGGGGEGTLGGGPGRRQPVPRLLYNIQLSPGLRETTLASPQPGLSRRIPRPHQQAASAFSLGTPSPQAPSRQHSPGTGAHEGWRSGAHGDGRAPGPRALTSRAAVGHRAGAASGGPAVGRLTEGKEHAPLGAECGRLGEFGAARLSDNGVSREPEQSGRARWDVRLWCLTAGGLQGPDKLQVPGCGHAPLQAHCPQAPGLGSARRAAATCTLEASVRGAECVPPQVPLKTLGAQRGLQAIVSPKSIC